MGLTHVPASNQEVELMLQPVSVLQDINSTLVMMLDFFHSAMGFTAAATAPICREFAD